MIGKNIGSFEILEELGSGGMGTVFKAVDTMLDREVAVKMLHRELARQEQVVERFRAEAQLLARLSHPNVATVYSFFAEGDDLFLVLEYVPGQTVSEILQSSGALPWQRAVKLIRGALDGIAQAHSMGIVHRDLKPANLILAPGGTIKVMDFGIARIVGTSRLTRHGHVVGTVEYMSPEQVQGTETDARSDIYSLGVVLYEMLTGRVPFQGNSDFELMKAQIEAVPEAPRVFAPDVPEWLEAVVLRMLAKAPDQRFASVTEVAAALDAGSGAEPAVKATRLAAPAAPKTRLAAPPPPPAPAKPRGQEIVAELERRARPALAFARKLEWQHWVIAGSVLLVVVSLLLLLATSGGEPESGRRLADTGREPARSTEPEERPQARTPVTPPASQPLVPPRAIETPKPDPPRQNPPGQNPPGQAPPSGAPSPPPDPAPQEAPRTAPELQLETFEQRYDELVELADAIQRDAEAFLDDTETFLDRQGRWRPIGRDREFWDAIETLEHEASVLKRDLRFAGDKYRVSKDGKAKRLLRKARRGVVGVGDLFTGEETAADLAALRRQIAALDRLAVQMENARIAVQGGGSLASGSQKVRSNTARLRQRFP